MPAKRNHRRAVPITRSGRNRCWHLLISVVNLAATRLLLAFGSCCPLDALPVTQARVKKESVKALKTTRLIHKEQRCMKNLFLNFWFYVLYEHCRDIHFVYRNRLHQYSPITNYSFWIIFCTIQRKQTNITSQPEIQVCSHSTTLLFIGLQVDWTTASGCHNAYNKCRLAQNTRYRVSVTSTSRTIIKITIEVR